MNPYYFCRNTVTSNQPPGIPLSPEPGALGLLAALQFVCIWSPNSSCYERNRCDATKNLKYGHARTHVYVRVKMHLNVNPPRQMVYLSNTNKTRQTKPTQRKTKKIEQEELGGFVPQSCFPQLFFHFIQFLSLHRTHL